MNHYRFLLALGLTLMWMTTARSGILFGKKQNPAQRVPQLITIVKTDQSDSAREKAAAELREYDATAFPEITAVLIDVLQHDSKAGVRSEAAQSLGKLRPISQEAGMALEEATRDSSLRVRWQARSALLGYRISGYRSQKPADAARGQENRLPAQAIGGPFSGHMSASPRTSPIYLEGETPPPPLAPPVTVSQPPGAEARPAIQPASAEPRPLPVGPPSANEARPFPQPPSTTQPRSPSQPAKPEMRPPVDPTSTPKPPPPPAATPDSGPDLPG
jgi:hypothetical protein